MPAKIPIDKFLLTNLKGFLDETEGQHLYEIALDASRIGPCLEIGGYCGKSTTYIGIACKQNRQILFSIDHHRGSEEHQYGEEYFDANLYDAQNEQVDTFLEFRKTLKLTNLEDTVVPIVCKSELAARKWTTPLGMVFIDGGHSSSAAFTDYSAWAGHIMPEGYLLIHDIFENPQKGGQAPYHIYNLALGSGLFHEHPRTKTLGILQRNPCKHLDYNPPKP